MADFDFLSENPKLIQRRIASGSIPLPSSIKSNKFWKHKLDTPIPIKPVICYNKDLH